MGNIKANPIRTYRSSAVAASSFATDTTEQTIIALDGTGTNTRYKGRLAIYFPVNAVTYTVRKKISINGSVRTISMAVDATAAVQTVEYEFECEKVTYTVQQAGVASTVEYEATYGAAIE